MEDDLGEYDNAPFTIEITRVNLHEDWLKTALAKKNSSKPGTGPVDEVEEWGLPASPKRTPLC